MECPACGSTTVQTLQIACERNQSSSSHQGISVGAFSGQPGALLTYGTSQTVTSFGRRLQPPRPRNVFVNCIGLLAALFIPVCLVVMASFPATLQGERWATGINLVWFACVLIPVSFLWKGQSGYNHDVFPIEYDRWQWSIVCYTCGAISDRQEQGVGDEYAEAH
jgi:hypothetical protein